MKILLLALPLVLAVGCGGYEEAIGSTQQAVTGPGCTDGDCPVQDPGCSDGGCDPNYRANCCCGNPEPDQRICCCKSDFVYTCRSTPIPENGTFQDATLYIGKIPPGKNVTPTKCAPSWFPEWEDGHKWLPKTKECKWMKKVFKLRRCGDDDDKDGDDHKGKCGDDDDDHDGKKGKDKDKH